MLAGYRDATLTAPLPTEDPVLAPTPTIAPFADALTGESITHRLVNIGGVDLHAITERECIAHILKSLDDGTGGTVVTPNLDIIRNCRKDLRIATLVAESDLAVPDGMPLIWASRIQGTPLPQRIAGSDLISSLSAAAANVGRSIFLLGGTPGAAEGAAKVLQDRSPNLKISGIYCPPMGFEKNVEEMRKIESMLRQTNPDIIWVALGSPKQEKLIAKLKEILPASWWLGVGISFSFLTGEVSRAPRWVQKLGLEWCHRLIQEPGRLAKRYLVHGLPFFAVLLAEATGRRLTGNKPRSQSRQQLRGRKTKIKKLTPITSALGVDSVVNFSLEALPVTQRRDFTRAPRVASRFGPTERGLTRLKSVILLGGKVRQSSLSSAVGRSVLDLPLDSHSTILTNWITHSTELAKRVGLNDLTVRVMVDQKAHEPISGATIDTAGMVQVRVERDQSSLRGTGGLIADIAKDYDDEDMILVASASQVLLDPLVAIAQALDHKTGEFTLISHRDGTAGGIMLLKCKTVRAINDIGYIDLKEQALPTIAKTHDVRVVHCRQPTGVPLFSLTDYITALQMFHRRRSSRRAKANPLGEEFNRLFAIVEPGATVAPDAYLHDAVVLKGATVESGASAIRSLVLPGAVIGRGQHVSDGLVTAN